MNVSGRARGHAPLEARNFLVLLAGRTGAFMTTDDAFNLPPVPSGVVAGKYELVQLIGRGGMGSVWEGRHKTLGTRVAIKFIDAEYANSADARNRFDNEARAAATIQSKHAIQVYDHGLLEDGRPYIVMELLLGEPLDTRLKRMTRLSLQETTRILQQVCRALGRAHERGIIHRDLKPENVFLVHHPDDDDEIAKVLDFGIAKIRTTPGAVGVSSSTKTGTLLGTPFYMSPEQARGLRNVDHRSDLWSLGVIVFRCITGQLPFDGESLGDLLVKICTSPIPVPSHFMPGLPGSVDAWMARALDREPERRFQTAQELSEALAYACGVSVRRPMGASTPTPNLGVVATSSRTGAPMSASQAQVAGIAPASFAQPVPPATSAPITASTPVPGVPKRSRNLLFSILAAMVLGLGAGVILVLKLKAQIGPSTAPAASDPLPSAVVSAPPPPPVYVVEPTPQPSASASSSAEATPAPPPTGSATAAATKKKPTHGKPASNAGAAGQTSPAPPSPSHQNPAPAAGDPGY